MSGVFALLEIRHQCLQRVLPIGLLFAALPALAHHSYAAFDSAHTRALKGTVNSIQWGESACRAHNIG